MQNEKTDLEKEETAQEKFDRLYISSVEILNELKISRAAVCQARRRGMLPDAITSHGGSMVLWERDTIRPYLDAWKLILNVRRSHNV